jgi:4-amino-4-deoxy-L-arabinose transferase-like glycosyltransferase
MIAVLGLAFAVRTLSLDAQGLWRDEVDALRFATDSWSEVLARFTQPGWNGPFYFLMLRGWIALTGRSAFAMRYLSTLWDLVGLALLYSLGRRLLGRQAAGRSVVLASFSPYLVWYAQEVKMYTWVPALVLAALYAVDRLCRRGRWTWWIVAFVSTLLAIYSHILAALLLPVAGAWFLLRRRWRPPARVGLWIAGLALLMLLAILYRPLLSWQLPLAFQQRETGYASRTLAEMAQILISGWSTGITGWGQPWLTIGMAAVALTGSVSLFVRRRVRRLIALLIWLAGPLIAVWFVSLRGPIFTDRYLIWSAPAFYLLVGAGLDQIARWLERGPVDGLRFLLLVLLAFMLIGDGVNLYRQVVRPIKPQFREATRYLYARRAPDALLLFQIPYNHIVVGYYAPAPLDPWAEAPYTNWRSDDGSYQVQAGDVADQMRELTAGYEEVWLIYSEATMWDERELVKAWLETHGNLVEERHFHLVELYHFRLPRIPSSP